jgi:hypothetical protein
MTYKNHKIAKTKIGGAEKYYIITPAKTGHSGIYQNRAFNTPFECKTAIDGLTK